MGSKAVEKFRSLHPSHHLLLSSLSVRLTVERAGDKRKNLNRLKSVNSRLATEHLVVSKSHVKPYHRVKKTRERKERGQKTVRWSQQLIKVHIDDFLHIKCSQLSQPTCFQVSLIKCSSNGLKSLQVHLLSPSPQINISSFGQKISQLPTPSLNSQLSTPNPHQDPISYLHPPSRFNFTSQYP